MESYSGRSSTFPALLTRNLLDHEPRDESNMYAPRPDHGDRSRLFNPEAATFSPSVTGIKPLRSPEAVNSPLQSAASGLEQEPRGIAESLNASTTSNTCADSHQTSDMAQEHMIGALDGSQYRPGLPTVAFVSSLMKYETPNTGHVESAAQPVGSSSTAIDVHELSAGLGLSGPHDPGSSSALHARSLKSNLSHGFPDNIYDLAHYLPRERNSGHGNHSAAASELHNSVIRPTLIAHDTREALKRVEPPPGFANTPARVTKTEQPATNSSVQSRRLSTDTAIFIPHRRPSLASTIGGSPQHTHTFSARRHIRAYTRSKRTDQGPEPSAADIYPEDAHWASPPHHAHSNISRFTRRPFQPDPSPRHHLRVNDASDWPTPAEVYTPPQAPQASSFTLLDKHIRSVQHSAHTDTRPTRTTSTARTTEHAAHPTAADIQHPHTEATDLLNALVFLSANVLSNPCAADAESDQRPLSPRQVDGSRYGLRFYGLALGDEWVCPDAAEGEPFRVRPRM
ncbi:hypothetical protein ACN47E_004341 [Coniothyrium glycines]